MTQFHLKDPALQSIAEKVSAGRASLDARTASRCTPADLVGIGQMADHVRRQKNGDNVYFMVNRHINPTNICLNRCKFCAFSRDPEDNEGAYEMTLDEIVARRRGSRAGRRARDPHRRRAAPGLAASTTTST